MFYRRPSVSNDKPFSGALFKTLRYVPAYPAQPFENIDVARRWVAKFCIWYNYCYHHSGLKFVTPTQRHNGTDKDILEKRKSVYKMARSLHAERWSGRTRDWENETAVELNPVKIKQEIY